MHRYRSVIACFCCFAWAGLAVAATPKQSEPQGMILGIEGDVMLERAGSQSPAELAELLFEGDRLVSRSGRATIIYCPDKKTLRIQPDSTSILDSSGFRTLVGEGPDSKDSNNCVLPQIALGTESLEHVGALTLRSSSPPIPLYLGGRVSQSRPTFSWAPVENAKSYRLKISNLQGNTLWEHRTEDLSIAYPDSKKALAKGDYAWELSAFDDNATTAYQLAVFRIEPASMTTSHPAGSDAERLLRAVELENAGYYSEAAREFSILLSGNTDDTRLMRRIAWLYWNAGLSAAAEEIMLQLNSAP